MFVFVFVPVIKAVSSVNWVADCTVQEIGKSLKRVLEWKKMYHILWPTLIQFGRQSVRIALLRSDLIQDHYCRFPVVGQFAHERQAKGSIKYLGRHAYLLLTVHAASGFTRLSLRRILHCTHLVRGFACENRILIMSYRASSAK